MDRLMDWIGMRLLLFRLSRFCVAAFLMAAEFLAYSGAVSAGDWPQY